MSLWDSSSQLPRLRRKPSEGRLALRLTQETSEQARGLGARPSCSPPPLSATPARPAPPGPDAPDFHLAPQRCPAFRRRGRRNRKSRVLLRAFGLAHSRFREGVVAREPAGSPWPPSLSRAPRMESPAEARRRQEAALGGGQDPRRDFPGAEASGRAASLPVCGKASD